ncbi:MAG: rhodanese-like domain-containing protein [Gammaproteobacteria bacterium]|nr:rhodanese-like domain-containing protein [Gammaproteobacteria bacterium]MDH5628873.1 rhodanese-like domain-containing protein [Gammaproteobacteria bacterium]
MSDFPLPLAELFGHWGSYVVYLVIGLLFGYVLESAGFGNSKKLAAQFYFKDLAVFKVMFTAIIVAMTLIFLATAVGILDFNFIWVPPTYLWPGILGGFIMGIGFIIGGFCPGTSLVAMATAKIDGFFFVAGVLIGIFIFGESVSSFDVFFNSHNYGRYTLPELFDTSYGVVVLSVVVAALLMFWGAEKIERSQNKTEPYNFPVWGIPSASVLVVTALVVVFLGQPTNQDRWNKIADQSQKKIDERQIQISPAELLHLMNDSKLKPVLLDVRDEADYNLFHIHGSKLMPMDLLQKEGKSMQYELANTVFVIISNEEKRATEAWKILKAESVQNLYLLEGGINHWLESYADSQFLQENLLSEYEEDCLKYDFKAALGDRFPAAEPEYDKSVEFVAKIKLELKRAPTSGGCG